MSSKKSLLDFYKSTKNPSLKNNINNNDYLLLYILTYNLFGKIPSSEEIPLLFPNINELQKFDIYIISTQECLQTASIFTSEKTEWEQALQNFLGENYINVINQNLGAIHLSIFIKKEKIINFSNFRRGEIKTGFMNLFPNKGAVSASMKYFDKNILFIGCHLAAGQDKINERNNDLLRVSKSLKTSINFQKKEEIINVKKTFLHKTIIKKENKNNNNINYNKSKSVLTLNQIKKEENKNRYGENKEDEENKKFYDNIEEVESNKDDNEEDLMNKRIKNTEMEDDKEDKLIEDYDFVILSGDLNYRLNISQDDIEEIINKNNPEILWDKDQLNTDIKKEYEFDEGIINFMPTYKYIKNTDKYDNKRIPGWTDRILYKSKKKYDIMLCEYNSMQNVNISDHKPVYAIFKLNTKNTKKDNNLYNINNNCDKNCIIF